MSERPHKPAGPRGRTAASPNDRPPGKRRAADLDTLAAWIAFHKEVRELLHTGDVVHADLPNPALLLEGVVATDRSDALYRLAALDLTVTWPAGRVRLPGLDPARDYHVSAQAPGDAAAATFPPGWGPSGVTLPGRVLREVGIQAPLLNPDQLVLLRARALPTAAVPV